jgi:hypothetical protein
MPSKKIQNTVATPGKVPFVRIVTAEIDTKVPADTLTEAQLQELKQDGRLTVIEIERDAEPAGA